MKKILVLLLALLGMSQVVAQDYEYVPFVREGVKWVYSYINTVKDPIQDLARGKYYLTLEMKGEYEIKGKTYIAVHKYRGKTINSENDTIPIYLREEEKVVYGIIPDGKAYNDCPIGNSYMDNDFCNGEEFVLYDFSDPVSFLDGIINHKEMLPDAYEPVYEDYLDIGGIPAKRYVGQMYGGVYEFSYIEGIGYDTQSYGYTLCMFMGAAVGFETTIFTLNHVEEEGKIIYKGYHYDPDMYEGILGDVNGDENVNITDVTALIDCLLTSSNVNKFTCDLNMDREITITDVTALIDLLIDVKIGAGGSSYSCDVNGDSNVSIADVSALIDMLLVQP